jgi:hypothetical protein
VIGGEQPALDALGRLIMVVVVMRAVMGVARVIVGHGISLYA